METKRNRRVRCMQLLARLLNRHRVRAFNRVLDGKNTCHPERQLIRGVFIPRTAYDAHDDINNRVLLVSIIQHHADRLGHGFEVLLWNCTLAHLAADNRTLASAVRLNPDDYMPVMGKPA